MAARALSRTLPFGLLAIMGYVSWIMVRPVAYDYFFQTGRRGNGIAVLVVYFLLLSLEVSTYVRLLCTVASDPAYLTSKAKASQPPSNPFFNLLPHRRGEKLDETKGLSHYHASLHRIIPLGRAWPAPTLEDFLSKDVFMCDEQGLPRWCSTCRIWRPDRARHVREVDRCVLKADHVCFWVGGVVSEHNIKFFVQFNFYTVLYASFDMVVAAVCIGQARAGPATVNGHWIAMLIMGIFFMMLTLGITVSMTWNTVVGLTTPENVAAQNGHEWRMAVKVPDGAAVRSDVQTIKFPDIREATYEELSAQLDTATPRHGPTYAILTTKPRTNPWDVGWWQNFHLTMGFRPWDWVLPFRRSPWLSSLTYCTSQRAEAGFRKDQAFAMGSQSKATSFFPTGVDLEAAKAEAGLRQPLTDDERRLHEFRLMRRHGIPYLLGGAGAPKKQWAAFKKHLQSRGPEESGVEQGYKEEQT